MHFKYTDYIVGGGVIIWTCWCAACKMQSETTHGRHVSLPTPPMKAPPPISSADNWQFIHIIWSTSPHYSSGKSPLLFVIFTCSLSWPFTQAEHFLNLKPLTGYTFSYWWIFQKYETLWKVGFYRLRVGHPRSCGGRCFYCGHHYVWCVALCFELFWHCVGIFLVLCLA